MSCCPCFAGLAKGGGNKEELKRKETAQTEIFEQSLHFISKVPLFSSLPLADHPTLAKAFILKDYVNGQDIITQGDMGSEFFVIRKGDADVVINLPEGEKVVNTLGSGDFFGEVALLYNSKRNATIRAKGDVQCLSITKQDFTSLDLRKKLTFKKRKAMHMAEDDSSAHPPTHKSEAEKMFIKEAFVKNKFIGTYLTHMSDQELISLSDSAFSADVPANTEIIKKGDTKADLFYIMQEGAGEAIIDGNVVESYGAGGSFGGLALLFQAPRAATVKITAQSKLWCIPRAALRAVFQNTVKERVQNYAKVLKKVELFSDLTDQEITTLADALTRSVYNKGELVTEQGEDSSAFFILEEGELLETEDGKETGRIKRTGDDLPYFAEKALMEENPYYSTRKVVSEKATLLVVGREVFSRFTSISRHTTFKHKELVEYDKAKLTTLGLLGCGGFGKVTLEKYEPTGQHFALKALSKGYVCAKNQQKSTMNEKTILRMTHSNFLVQCAATFNTPQHLYFLLEPALGGELFTVYMRHDLHGKERLALFYSACVIKGLQHLHERCIVYRDMKPENLLLDEWGYCKIADFGLAKFCVGKTFTTCGTPDYFAPELVKGVGHTTSLDWWTLGILIYELMTGQPPFAADEPSQIFAKMMKGIETAPFPRDSTGWADVVKGLCKMDPAERLPVRPGGVRNLEKHRWWRGNKFDWHEMMGRTMKAPFLPEVDMDDADTSNFDACEDEAPPEVEYVDPGDGWDDDFEDKMGPSGFVVEYVRQVSAGTSGDPFSPQISAA